MSLQTKERDHHHPALIDVHAHIELDPLVKEPEKVVNRALEAGVMAIITVGIDLDDVGIALELADRFEQVYASVGFHPHNAKAIGDNSLSEMEKYARHPKVVGYGEIGLDFFRNRSPRDVQIGAFRDQLILAKRLGKPVVIHLRDAYDEGLRMLEQEAPFPRGGVIHCFSGGGVDARRALELGFHISIPGTVTYKKNDQLRGIVKNLPIERILLETDCPFLTPEPFRGRDNEPAYIVHTAKRVAEVRGMAMAEIAAATSENALRLFRLPPSLLEDKSAKKPSP
jgi:TatD DNase family protein